MSALRNKLMSEMKWAVGMKVWMTPCRPCGRWGEPREVTITKVGRKYLTVDYSRLVFSLEDGGEHRDGCSSSHVLWPSKEAWETDCVLSDAWRKLENDIISSKITVASLDDIEAARKLLGLS